MRSLVKAEAKPGLTLKNMPVPEYGRQDVLIKIKKTAICGTDVHIYKWDEWAQRTIPVPMTVGHEFVGEVAAVGTDVQHFKIGDRVSGEGHLVCGVCRACRAGRYHLCRNTVGVGVNRPGAFAEYLSIPAFNTFKIPDSIDDDLVAIFDPLGNAAHTALSFNLVGEDVLICGAGPIGIMGAAICRQAGARHIVITDINPQRLALAEKFDISAAVNMADCPDTKSAANKLTSVMHSLGMTEGYDVVLEMSGHPSAINSAIQVCNTGAKLALLGLSGRSDVAIDWDTMVFKSLIMKGIYGREMFETWYKMITMIESGLDLSPIITDHFDVADYEKGFEKMIAGNCGKVILNW